MCGIAGVVRWDGGIETGVVARMTAALAHRGPDSGTVAGTDGAVFGHQRLAVIDTAHSADQPMVDRAGGAWIVFNGEIYNFRDLRKGLMEQGVRFTTQGDTEVLLKGMAHHGVGWISQLVGMFAFAFWDPRSRSLLLVRDRLGKKPLYFSDLGGEIVFASELTALRAHPGIGGNIDEAALAHYLAYGYTPTSRCIIKGARKLAPASWMSFGPDGERRGESYWDLAAAFRRKQVYASDAEAAEALGPIFDQAVAARLVSDVPLGTFLSGGIDSAGVAESIRRQSGGGDTKSITIDFDDRDHSEAAAASRTAAALEIPNTIKSVGEDALVNLENIARYSDEPFADTSILPTFHLSRLARDQMTVALSGDGGDELFAGYPTYAADQLHGLTGWLPDPLVSLGRCAVEKLLPHSFGKVGADYKIRRFLSGHGLDAARAHCHWRGIFDAPERAGLVLGAHATARDADPFDDIAPFFAEVADLDPLDQASFVDFKTWLVDDILFKVDRMSMAHGLEVRVPFLDHRLVEFAAGLPAKLRYRRFKGKRVLRRYLETRLPRAILDRRKAGFNAPVSRWFEGPTGAHAREIMTQGVMGDWFHMPSIDALWNDHLARRRDNGYRLFALLCLSTWFCIDPMGTDNLDVKRLRTQPSLV